MKEALSVSGVERACEHVVNIVNMCLCEGRARGAAVGVVALQAEHHHARALDVYMLIYRFLGNLARHVLAHLHSLCAKGALIMCKGCTHCAAPRSLVLDVLHEDLDVGGSE